MASNLLLLFVLFLSYFPYGDFQKVHLHYPISIQQIDNNFDITGVVESQELTCFHSSEHGKKSYLQILLCFTSLLSSDSCTPLWGSRSVVLTVQGSVEFVKSSQLPILEADGKYGVFNGTRWIEMHSSDGISKREIVQIPAEPIVICGRSSHHSGQDSHFEISFRHPFIRERDMRQSFEKLFYHVLLLLATSSMWLLPYIVSLTVAIYSYIHGIKIILILLVGSFLIVSLFPIMMMKQNRELMKLYISYFFSRKLATETKILIRKQKPLFQALYFSCILLHIGSISSYLLYYYVGMDREMRNHCLKITIGISISWFTFFVCRTFEYFLSQWMWVVMSFGLAQRMEIHINPGYRNEMILCCGLISLLESYCIRCMQQTELLQYIALEMGVAMQVMIKHTMNLSMRLKTHHSNHSHSHHHNNHNHIHNNNHHSNSPTHHSHSSKKEPPVVMSGEEESEREEMEETEEEPEADITQ